MSKDSHWGRLFARKLNAADNSPAGGGVARWLTQIRPPQRIRASDTQLNPHAMGCSSSRNVGTGTGLRPASTLLEKPDGASSGRDGEAARAHPSKRFKQPILRIQALEQQIHEFARCDALGRVWITRWTCRCCRQGVNLFLGQICHTQLGLSTLTAKRADTMINGDPRHPMLQRDLTPELIHLGEHLSEYLLRQVFRILTSRKIRPHHAHHNGIQMFHECSGGILVLLAHSNQAICDIQSHIYADYDSPGPLSVTAKPTISLRDFTRSYTRSKETPPTAFTAARRAHCLESRGSRAK